MPEGNFVSEVSCVDGVLKVSISSELTFREREQLETILRTLAISSAATEVEIDLSTSPFIDSTAVLFLLAMYKLFNSHITVIVALKSQPEAIIKRTNTADLFNLRSKQKP